MNFTRTCVECGICLYEHEWELLDGMCLKCFNELNNGVRAEELIREFYRKQYDEIIKKG